MGYKINFTNTNKQSITVDDLSLNNTDTSLVFVGKNYPGYAQFIGENFLHLLENFASSSEPANPIEGQLWYDTSSSQLKVRDSGARWIEASGIKKSELAPSIANPGDLWVNSTTQQLYLFNASNQWVLIGPQFNETSSTGFKAEEVIDRATNTAKFVVSVLVDNRRVAMFSTQEFSPKLNIPGFSIIRQGITLSSEDFDNDGLFRNKYWGTAEKADALIVGNSVVPAANFLRSDVASVSNFPLNVRSSTGISLGESLESTLSSGSSGLVISQKTGGSIFLNTTSLTTGASSVVTVTADNKVGINKLQPTKELDIAGDILASGNTSTGTLNVSGLASINRVALTGISTSNEKITFGPANYTAAVKTIIDPGTHDKFNIGTSTNRFNTVFSTNLNANTLTVGSINLTGGTIAGNITGTAGSLATTTNFSVTGEITSNTINFNGANQTAQFTTTVLPTFVASKEKVSKAETFDRFLIYRPSSPSEPVGPGSGSYKQISQADLFASFSGVPIGSIFAFGGTNPPQDYLLCDGAIVSRAVYARLFSVIGTRYGAGNGSTTFGLPDLRGRFPAGFEGMNNVPFAPGVTATPTATRNPGASTLGNVGGEFQRTITEAQMPNHGHLFDDIRYAEVFSSVYTYNDPMLGPISVGPGPGSRVGLDYDNGVYFTRHGTFKTGGNQPMNIMNPFLTVNYIIYTGGVV